MPTPQPIRYRSKSKPQQPQAPPNAAGVIDLGAHMKMLKQAAAGQQLAASVSRVPQPNPFWGHNGFRARVTGDIATVAANTQQQFALTHPQPTQEQVNELMMSVNSIIAARYIILGAILGDAVFDANDMSEHGISEMRTMWADVIELVNQYAHMNNERFQQLLAVSLDDPIPDPVPDQQVADSSDDQEHQHHIGNMPQ